MTSFQSPGPGWVWDLHPLAKSAWRNRQVNAHQKPGEVVMMREPVKRGPTGEAPGALMESRKGYRPTADDVEIMQRAFPDADAHNPSWPRVEAKLIAGGRKHEELSQSNAPTLVVFLEALLGSPTAAVTTPPIGSDPKVRAKWSPSPAHCHHLERARDDFMQASASGIRIGATVVTGLLAKQVPWDQLFGEGESKWVLGNGTSHAWGGMHAAVCIHRDGDIPIDIELFMKFAANAMYWLHESGYPDLFESWKHEGNAYAHWVTMLASTPDIGGFNDMCGFVTAGKFEMSCDHDDLMAGPCIDPLRRLLQPEGNPAHGWGRVLRTFDRKDVLRLSVDFLDQVLKRATAADSPGGIDAAEGEKKREQSGNASKASKKPKKVRGGRKPISGEDAQKRREFAAEVIQRKLESGTTMKEVADDWGISESDGKAWKQWVHDQDKS